MFSLITSRALLAVQQILQNSCIPFCVDSERAVEHFTAIYFLVLLRGYACLLEYLQVFRMYSFRMDDDEVERFGVAANGDMSKFVATMKKTVQWRENYHFLPESDLQTWSHLIFWHLHDAQGRPILVIRLGAAYSTIAPSDRPRFAQAVGMHNYLLLNSISIVVMHHKLPEAELSSKNNILLLQ
jgi:hypothetical protein